MSDPGYPLKTSTFYSYPSSYTDAVGNVYSGSNGGGFFTSFKDLNTQDTPGWPHNIRTNGYGVVSLHLPEAGCHYMFTHVENGQERASGGDSLVHKCFGDLGVLALADLALWPHWTEIREVIRSRVVQRLAENVKNSKVNLAQAVVERDQVFRMVSDTAKRIASAIHELRKGNIAAAATSLTGSSHGPRGRVRRVAGGIPEQWLALQYGWKPLLSDIYGSCEELANLMNYQPDAYSVRCAASSVSEYEHLVTIGPGSPNVRWKTKLSAKGNAGVWYRVGTEGGAFLNRTGITNPLDLAWEELPWSFVVDWFYPVGNFLENMDYSNGLLFDRGFISTKFSGEISGTAENLSTWPAPFTGGGWTSSKAVCTVQGFIREALSSWPAVYPPHFKNPLSPNHVANALSLLASAFSGGPSLSRRASGGG